MNDDDKMLIDWCPICGKKLCDFKKETRLNHDKKFHSSYFTAQTEIKIDDFVNNNDLK